MIAVLFFYVWPGTRALKGAVCVQIKKMNRLATRRGLVKENAGLLMFGKTRNSEKLLF